MAENISEVTISRSAKRSINLKNYGGNEYENEEFFASYSGTLPADATEGDQHKLSYELHRRAIADVTKAVTEVLPVIKERTFVEKIEADKKRIENMPKSKPSEEIPF